MTAPFTSSASLSAAWKAFVSHWKFLVPTTIGTAIILIILRVATRALENHWLPMLVFTIISIVAGIVITLGWTNISLRLVRAHSIDLQDFKTNKKSWGHYFLARLIYGVFAVVSMVLILVPMLLLVISAGSIVPLVIIGIIAGIAGLVLFIWLAIRYMFISYVAVDHPTMGAWDMLKESAKLGKGNMIDLFGFGLLLFLVNVVGFLLILLGLLVTVPLSKIAVAHVYEQLKKKHHTVSE